MSISAVTSPPCRLRLVPVPSTDPPYDEAEQAAPLERNAATNARGQDTLPFPARDPAPLRLVDPADHRRVSAHAFSHRFVQAVVEVLLGARPVGQLTPYASSSVLKEITLLRYRDGASYAAWLRAAPDAVRSLHVSTPAPNRHEVCGRLVGQRRSRAVCLRLERRGDALRCTAFAIL